MRSAIDPTLISLITDAFLLARFAGPTNGRPSGRSWERAVSELLWRPGFSRRQHAGLLGLFGRDSASGARHELDGAGQGFEIGAWIESKACEAVDKSHAAVFHLKCFDFYRATASAYPAATAEARWWPLLVSSEPGGEAVRRICCDLGIVLCDPQRLPLPVLMHAAGKPNADDYLPEAELGELVRLTERACVPMQRRWRIDPKRRTVELELDRLSAGDIGDLLFLQDELTEDLLDAIEMNEPGYLERRATRLADRLRAASLAS